MKREEIIVGGRNLEKLKPLEAEFTGLQITTDTEKLVEQADIIILAVKPYTIPEILTSVKEKLTPDKIIISVAAGVTIQDLEELTSAKQNCSSDAKYTSACRRSNVIRFTKYECNIRRT